MKSKLSENGLIKCIESVCCEYATKELLKSAHKCTPFDTYLRRKKNYWLFRTTTIENTQGFFSSFDSNYFTFYFIIYNKRREKSYTQLKMNVLSWSGDRLSEYANWNLEEKKTFRVKLKNNANGWECKMTVAFLWLTKLFHLNEWNFSLILNAKCNYADTIKVLRAVCCLEWQAFDRILCI